VKRKAAPAGGCSDIEQRFVAEYLVDLSQAGAMERADGGKRKKAWKELGYQMMQRPHVREAIEKALKKHIETLDLTAQKVLWDIDRIATRAEQEGDFPAALKGRELLGKYLKLFTEKHEHGGIGGGPVVLQVTEADTEL
jgi:phage terminase small subunit